MSLMGREVPFHQSISFGSCFRYYWAQSKVKAGSVDHHLILELSSPGFLHQADQVIPLFETFKRLTLSKNPTPLTRSIRDQSSGSASFISNLPPSSPPCCGHTCFSNNQVRAWTALLFSLLGKISPQPFK